MPREKQMCAECVVDPVLIAIIEREGKRGLCDVCGERRKSASVIELAEPVLRAYHSFVKPAEDILDPDDDSDNFHRLQGGSSPNEILQELVGCEPAAADVLLEALADLDWRSVREGGDDLFSAEQYGYNLEPPESDLYERRWRAFERSVKHESRFFNAAQRRYLQDLFAPLLRGELSEGRPPLAQIGSEGSILTRVFRAREANDELQRAHIYEQPAREMGPPPPHRRRQGRMNAAGIGVFYGSSDAQTSVAELRVPVGGTAVVGEFTFRRPVTVLDLRELEGSSVPAGISWLQDDFEDRYAYATFMRGLHDLIRRPVLPDAESLDYLPTQIIAEYLASLDKPRIEGLLFTSSQKARPQDPGGEESMTASALNVVLFARAAVVEGHDRPPARRVTNVNPFAPVGDEDSWGLTDEWVSYEPLRHSTPSSDDIEDEDLGSLHAIETLEAEPASKPTLRINDGALRVIHVRGVVYETVERGITFSDSTKPTNF